MENVEHNRNIHITVGINQEFSIRYSIYCNLYLLSHNSQVNAGTVKPV